MRGRILLHEPLADRLDLSLPQLTIMLDLDIDVKEEEVGRRRSLLQPRLAELFLQHQ